MLRLPDMIEALASVPLISLRATLVRIVPLGDLVKHSPPDFLFTSGKPNRYNPAGLECVYFAEDEATARLEYASQWHGLREGKQPLVIYFAEVRLGQVIDLGSRETLNKLKLKPGDLHKSWRGASRPTATQLLGQITCEHTRISAIRFPSSAAKRAGKTGWNIVIFRYQLRTRDSVRILGGRAKYSLQRWPD